MNETCKATLHIMWPAAVGDCAVVLLATCRRDAGHKGMCIRDGIQGGPDGSTYFKLMWEQTGDKAGE